MGRSGDEVITNSESRLRPEPRRVHGCHAPYVAHGGMQNVEFGEGKKIE